jgi:hypothetical protein
VNTPPALVPEPDTTPVLGAAAEPVLGPESTATAKSELTNVPKREGLIHSLNGSRALELSYFTSIF